MVVGKPAVRAPVALGEPRVVGGAAATDVDGAGFSMGVTAPVGAAVEPASSSETDTAASDRATDEEAPTLLVRVRTAVA